MLAARSTSAVAARPVGLKAAPLAPRVSRKPVQRVQASSSSSPQQKVCVCAQVDQGPHTL